MERGERMEEALRLYSAAVGLTDPVRFDAWSSLGLTMPTLKVLFLLRENPGSPSGALATRLGVTPSTVTGLVDRLVRQDLVRREEDRGDRRIVRNFLTPDGSHAVGDLERKSRSLLLGLLDELDDAQLDQLIAALGDLTRVAEHRAVAATGS
jgi:DNA-binding MarR family transcriptional regulator